MNIGLILLGLVFAYYVLVYAYSKINELYKEDTEPENVTSIQVQE